MGQRLLRKWKVHMNFTKEEILEIIKADYRQRVQFDEMVLEGLIIDKNTIIGEWTEVGDFLAWKSLSQHINEWFGVNIAWSEWKTTVFPEWEKTLGDLAELLAKYAIKPELQPIKLFGKPCLKAGVFKMLLQRLEKRGANIADIQPSTPISEWLKSNIGYLMQEVNLIAPKALPTLEVRFHKGYDYGFNLLMIGLFIFLLIGCLFGSYFLIILGIVMALTGYIVTDIFSRMNPTYVAFEGIATFRDLVENIIENK